MLARFAPTKRGGSKLYCDGFLYRYHKAGGGAGEKHLWKCEKANAEKGAPGCPARAETNGKDDGAAVKLGEAGHNHPPVSISMLEKEERICNMRKRALEEPTATCQQLAAGALGGADGGVLAGMPNKRALKDVVRRARAKRLAEDMAGAVDEAPPCETNLAELHIPHSLTTIDGDGNFLLSDSGPGDSRILIFGTDETVSFLTSCQVWSADGTFKVKHQRRVYPKGNQRGHEGRPAK